MSDITFVTAIFGERYMPFLLPHLYSVNKVHPAAKKLIYYSKLNKKMVNILQKKFNNIVFTEIETKESTKHDLLNDRMLAWELGAKNTDGPVVVIDVDIMLLKPINSFFKEDIVYTYRENHAFPLNLGIILLNNGKKSGEFMEELRVLTYNIFHSPEMQNARNTYGSCDQKAMFDLIETKKHKIHGVSCRILNEVDCTITKHTHAIHYKTSWHSIILDDQNWNENIPCQAAYDYWLILKEESKVFINANPLLP